MGIFQQFPYSNFHEMNLDQILKIIKDLQDTWNSTESEWNSYKEFIDNYFANLNVDDEVLQVISAMAADGSLLSLMNPSIAASTAQWLTENITQPVGVVIDRTLSVPGACADAEAVGYQIYNQLGIKANTKSILDTYEYGYYRAYDTGIKAPAEHYRLYDMIPIRPSTTYYLGITSNSHICYFDDYGTYMSGKVTANMTNEDIPIHIDSLTFTTPANARYCSISVNEAYNVEVYPYNEPSVIDSSLPNSVIKNMPRLFLENIENLPTQIRKISNKNLFNKNVVIEGYFCSEGSGRLIPVATFGVAYIPVKGSTTYTTVGFNNNHWAVMNSSGVRLDGGIIATDGSITTPATGAYLGVSVELSRIDNMAICEGSNAVYSDFGSGDVYKLSSGDIREVGAGQPYATINAAITAAADGDIILVHNGVYTESIIETSKNITLIGEDKYNTILQYSNADYSAPPLSISHGFICNMTIRCTEGGGNNKAYCVHLDNIGLQNQTMYFKDVIFYNPSKACVGIGLRGGCTVEFNSCEFRTEDAPAFYCHDWDSSSAANVEQFLKLVDCSLINNSATNPTIQLQSQEIANSSIGVRFQRNIIANVNGSGTRIGMRLWNPSIGGGGYLGSTRWYLAIASALNTEPQMNR